MDILSKDGILPGNYEIKHGKQAVRTTHVYMLSLEDRSLISL